MKADGRGLSEGGCHSGMRKGELDEGRWLYRSLDVDDDNELLCTIERNEA